MAIEIDMTPDQRRNLIIGIVAVVVIVALVLFFTLGRGDGAAQTAPSVQVQPAGGQPATTAAGAAPIIPPPSPLETQLGDIKNLDKFVQEKYNGIKNEADNQRAIALQTASLYQAQRLTEEAARRTTR